MKEQIRDGILPRGIFRFYNLKKIDTRKSLRKELEVNKNRIIIKQDVKFHIVSVSHNGILLSKLVFLGFWILNYLHV